MNIATKCFCENMWKTCKNYNDSHDSAILLDDCHKLVCTPIQFYPIHHNSNRWPLRHIILSRFEASQMHPTPHLVWVRIFLGIVFFLFCFFFGRGHGFLTFSLFSITFPSFFIGFPSFFLTFSSFSSIFLCFFTIFLTFSSFCITFPWFFIMFLTFSLFSIIFP